MKKTIFLATLMFASASVFGMDSAPDTGSEREKIQNNEVAPNQKKTTMKEEFSELMEAVKSNDLEKVKKICNYVDKVAVLNLLTRRSEEMSNDQIKEHHKKIFQNPYLTELVNLSNEKGNFPLLIAVENGNKEIVKYLVAHGADVNKKDKSERTPLICAARDENKEIVEYLVDHGADINIENTPLFWAVRNGNKEIVEYLVEHGANVNTGDEYKPDSWIIHDANERNPLILAIRLRYFEIAEYLINQGADVNILDVYGDTPLIKAIRNSEDVSIEDTSSTKTIKNGYFEIAKYLIDHGADVNKTSSYGKTPLYIAVLKGNKEIVKSLVDHGADVNIADSDGKTLLSIAKQKGFNEVVKILKTAGAK